MENDGLKTRIGNWLAHPFNANGSVVDWFLFLGVIIVIAFLWNTILNRLAEAYKEIV